MFDHEFIKRVAEATAARVSEMLMKEPEPTKNRRRVDGVRGIADFLHCSSATAQGMVNAGKFPVYRIGRKIFAFSDEIEDGIRENSREGRLQQNRASVEEEISSKAAAYSSKHQSNGR
jgi:hypothetical protein